MIHGQKLRAFCTTQTQLQRVAHCSTSDVVPMSAQRPITSNPTRTAHLAHAPLLAHPERPTAHPTPTFTVTKRQLLAWITSIPAASTRCSTTRHTNAVHLTSVLLPNLAIAAPSPDKPSTLGTTIDTALAACFTDAIYRAVVQLQVVQRHSATPPATNTQPTARTGSAVSGAGLQAAAARIQVLCRSRQQSLHGSGASAPHRRCPAHCARTASSARPV